MTRRRQYQKKYTANGRNCPSCGEDIGWAAGIKAIWPMSLMCPHCGEDLKYLDTRVVTSVMIVVAIFLIIAAFFISALLVPFQYQLLRIGLTAMFMMLLWIPVGLFAGKYLRSNKVLALKKDTGKMG